MKNAVAAGHRKDSRVQHLAAAHPHMSTHPGIRGAIALFSNRSRSTPKPKAACDFSEEMIMEYMCKLLGKSDIYDLKYQLSDTRHAQELVLPG
jgi:hypothetical protein